MSYCFLAIIIRVCTPEIGRIFGNVEAINRFLAFDYTSSFVAVLKLRSAMTEKSNLALLLLLLCHALFVLAANTNSGNATAAANKLIKPKNSTDESTTIQSSATGLTTPVNCSAENTNKTCQGTTTTKPDSYIGIFGVSKENFHMYLRAFYVLIAVAGVFVIYLLVKTIM